VNFGALGRGVVAAGRRRRAARRGSAIDALRRPSATTFVAVRVIDTHGERRMGVGIGRRLGFACAAIAGVAAGVVPAASDVSAGSPTTTTINEGASQIDPTSTSPIVFDVVFSRIVTLFDSSDIDLSTSTAGGPLVADVTGTGATYTVTVTGMTTSGSVVATIPAGAADDENGRPTPASTSVDNTVTWVGPSAPTVSINQGAFQLDPASTEPITFDVAFSESVDGFDEIDVDLSSSTAGGTLVAVVAGSGASYTVTVTGMTTSGDVVATIPAGAAQSGSDGDSDASTSIDNTVTWTQPDPPSVTVNQGAGQDDPASSSPIVFDVVFSEPVDGFDSSDVDLGASTVGGTLTPTVTGSGDTYTVTVDLPVPSALSGWRRVEAPSAGDVVVALPAGTATSVATGLPSLASTSIDNTVTWIGGTAPTTTTSPTAPTTTSPTGPTTTLPAGSTTTVPSSATTTTVAGGSSSTTTPASASLPATGPTGGAAATTLALAALACGGALVAVTRRRRA
jgi:LPXTG-motif cell wall-anchored protein